MAIYWKKFYLLGDLKSISQVFSNYKSALLDGN